MGNSREQVGRPTIVPRIGSSRTSSREREPKRKPSKRRIRRNNQPSPPPSHTAAVLIVPSGQSILRSARPQWTRMINRALALLILVLGLVAPAAAAELDEAVAAARGGDYAAALRRLSPLAERGDARAQFDIGFMHAYGWGLQRNPAEALAWYRKAA